MRLTQQYAMIDPSQTNTRRLAAGARPEDAQAGMQLNQERTNITVPAHRSTLMAHYTCYRQVQMHALLAELNSIMGYMTQVTHAHGQLDYRLHELDTINFLVLCRPYTACQKMCHEDIEDLQIHICVYSLQRDSSLLLKLMLKVLRIFLVNRHITGVSSACQKRSQNFKTPVKNVTVKTASTRKLVLSDPVTKSIATEIWCRSIWHLAHCGSNMHWLSRPQP